MKTVRSATVRSAFYVYWVGFKNALAARMAYRGDFFISALIVMLFEFIIPLVTLLIYRSGASFPGWTMYEALLIQALFLIAKGVAFPFVFGLVGNMFMHVREGTFDLVLIKPRSALFLSIATAIDTEDLGKFFGGVGMFLVVIQHLPGIRLAQWLQCGLLFLLALSVIFSFALIMSGTLFVWVGNGRVWEIFDTITMFGLYPRSIFSKGLQTFLTAVIPIAMIGFFPASVLLDKPHEGILLSVVVCLAFLGLSVKFWYKMMSNYTSAGG